ncbi:alkanesulfonate monooxygenase [Pilimelia anulata]|uniref:Alkanesulfonate monooxygenase n=1 Tax=Pilimelia anulata TaxID=53371 RepID=A0A8J3B9K3_9ACTN|nr:LLM class flavin-dependent oxidoreductase [Pilimelia anulata]GGK04169.1 alkanesulfonate monooxygenase [Pilimelia anulata]
MSDEYLWYIPNQVRPGHRGDDDVTEKHNSLATLTAHAHALEENGWGGALLGTGWGRPDTFTVATALTARTTTFRPLIAIRPGYWHPARFASAAATLDQLSGGRVLINIVSGTDNLAAYGDREGDQADRYARTAEFLRLVRRLWTEEGVTHDGPHFRVADSTVQPRPVVRGTRRHPTLYFGGASPAAERVAATEADVQLFWGEPLDGIRERIARLTALSAQLGRAHAPLGFGLRITTLVRDTTERAWADAEARVARMARGEGVAFRDERRPTAVGQQRLLDLAARGDVLDDNLYTAPGRYGGGGAGTTWLVGSAADVAAALGRYRDLGITHFVLSDTPYLAEIRRQGHRLLPLLRARDRDRAARDRDRDRDRAEPAARDRAGTAGEGRDRGVAGAGVTTGAAGAAGVPAGQ